MQLKVNKMEKITSGSIILLTRRKGESIFSIRQLITYLIARLTKSDNYTIDNVYVHSSIIYLKDEKVLVRDMDLFGNSSILFSDYKKRYNGRITVRINPFTTNEYKENKFIEQCSKTRARYDYLNLLVFQLLKIITGKFLRINTKHRRICSEDVARMFNILSYKFSYPEEITPISLYKFTDNWEEIKY